MGRLVSFSRIYLDTNTIIRAFEGSPEDEVSRNLVAMFGLVKINGPCPFVTSHITLAETLVHPIRRDDLQAQLEYKLLLSSSSHWLQVRQISQSILVQASTLRATMSIKLPDAIHAATAMLTKCSHILTSDTDFKLLDGNTSPALPATIRPTSQVTDEIMIWLRQ